MFIKRDMNKILYNILAGALLIVLSGCVKSGEGGGGKEQNTPVLGTVSIDVGMSTSTATTVVLACEVNLGEAASMPVDVFLRYSASESMNGDDVKTLKLKTGEQTVKLTGLVFGKTYFYETFLQLYDAEYNKVRNTFRTQDVEIEMSDPILNSGKVEIAGNLKGCGPDDRGNIALSLVILEEDGHEHAYSVDFADDGTFAQTVTGLDMASRYQYKAVVTQDDQKSLESAIGTFSTSDPYKDAVKSFADAADLAVSGTANTYIVSSPGVYRFPAVKGNSSDSVGAAVSVRILWESFGTAVAPSPLELISATGYKDGYAYIEVPSAFKEGNAVVAAYDSSDKILWSWHIWLTDDSIEEIQYANEAGTMMDRNLGALNAEANSAGALGLYYQWGRKDPFPGAASILDQVYAVATRRLKVTVNSDATSNVSFAVENPHKFILGNTGGDWMASKDDSLWASSKTIYAPCPAGWRVPDGGYNGGIAEGGMPDGIWAKAGFSRQGLTRFAEGDSGKLGKMFSVPFCNKPTWYPAAGSIECKAGTLYEVGIDGIYHSVSAFGGTDTYVTGLLFNYLPSLGGHYIYCGGEKFTRAGGASVRCCKE